MTKKYLSKIIMLICLVSVFGAINPVRALVTQPETQTTVGNLSPVFFYTDTPANAIPSDTGSHNGSGLAGTDGNPVNVGQPVTFTAYAVDANSDAYYLAVCKADDITQAAPPTCGAPGAWTVTVTPQANNTQESITYTAQGGDAESNAWWAFVCDASACFPADALGDQGNALGRISFTDVPADGESVRIENATHDYEFDAPGGVGCGGGALEVCVNCTSCQDGADAATALAAAEVANGTADTNAYARGSFVYVYSNNPGTAGNAYTLTETCDAYCTVTGGGTLEDGDTENASPFYVNHKPQITGVTINDSGSASIEPGEAVYFRTTVTDADSNGGADTASVYVCATTSYTPGSGCAANQRICYSANQALGTITCNSGDASGNLSSTYNPIPTSHGQKTAYVFAEDNHQFQADYSSGSSTRNYDVTDVPPVLTTYNSTDPISPPTLTPNVCTGTVTWTVELYDNNGDTDVQSVDGVVFDTGTKTNTCHGTQYDKDCYDDTSGGCAITLGGADQNLVATCSASDICFNANDTATWQVQAEAVDDDARTTDFANSGGGQQIDFPAVLALDVATGATLAYGTVEIGGTNPTAVETAVANVGNTVLDILLDGYVMCTSWSPPYTNCVGTVLDEEQQKWSTSSSFDWDTQGNVLVNVVPGASVGNAAAGCNNADIAVRGDDHSSTSTNESAYWKIRIPASQAAGSYTGANVFESTAGGGGCS